MADLNALALGMRSLYYDSRDGCLEELARRLESPLESTMFWALCCRFSSLSAAMDVSAQHLPGSVDPIGPAVDFWGAGRWWTAWPQLDVRTDAGDVYRIDLALEARDRVTGRTAIVALELDGHDFHERTKEQAERDRRRDRDLQVLGWKVARFTGSQVHRDVSATVEELVAFVGAVLAEPAVGAVAP